jgi:arylsulfatase A-like enzyme
VVKGPTRVPHLGCSLDVAPTLLGLIGRPYETMFFGRDLLRSPPEDGRVAIHHNRDIGLFTHDRMAVLGLRMGVEHYAGNPKQAEIQRVVSPTEADLEVERDAEALFQVADELYINRRYRIDP